MQVWAQIVIGIIALIIIATIVLQLPRGNRFVDVAGNKSLDKLRLKLDAGEDPDSRGTFGLTALHAAVAAGLTENVRLLLQRGARIRHPQAKLPILFSVEKTSPIEMVELLLEHGADPCERGFLDRCALEDAVDDPRLDQLRAYLAHGADPNTKGSDREPMLLSAIRLATKYATDDRLDVVRMLLEHGANPNYRTGEGVPALSFALENPGVLRLLLAHGAIKDVAWNGVEYGQLIDELKLDQP